MGVKLIFAVEGLITVVANVFLDVGVHCSNMMIKLAFSRTFEGTQFTLEFLFNLTFKLRHFDELEIINNQKSAKFWYE